MKIDFLIRKCGREIILHLFESKITQTATSIYKALDITYPYLCLIIKEMVKAELVTREKKGRQYNLSLTDKGFKVVKSLKFIENALRGEKC